uniref:Uncharacterized protein n=1 Tax=Kangiella spongicola TaxID=796379 RepID=A0A318D021_9GAMM
MDPTFEALLTYEGHLAADHLQFRAMARTLNMTASGGTHGHIVNGAGWKSVHHTLGKGPKPSLAPSTKSFMPSEASIGPINVVVLCYFTAQLGSVHLKAR